MLQIAGNSMYKFELNYRYMISLLIVFSCLSISFAQTFQNHLYPNKVYIFHNHNKAPKYVERAIISKEFENDPSGIAIANFIKKETALRRSNIATNIRIQQKQIVQNNQASYIYLVSASVALCDALETTWQEEFPYPKLLKDRSDKKSIEQIVGTIIGIPLSILTIYVFYLALHQN